MILGNLLAPVKRDSQTGYDFIVVMGPVCRMAFIAKAIMEPTSETVAGRMSVLVALANSPNLVMYCSATRSWTAS